MILKAYKLRLYPTTNQCVLIEKHIGSCRFVYNLALETKQIAHQSYQKNLSCFDLIKQIPDLKKDCEFLKEVNSQSLQASIKNLDTAYTNFFKNKAGFPKYKSKNKSAKSFNVPANVSICGELNKELTLSDRIWTCKNCQIVHDRDINAGKNIKNFALRDYKNLCVERTLKNQDELPAIVGVKTLEATIPLG